MHMHIHLYIYIYIYIWQWAELFLNWFLYTVNLKEIVINAFILTKILHFLIRNDNLDNSGQHPRSCSLERGQKRST